MQRAPITSSYISTPIAGNMISMSAHPDATTDYVSGLISSPPPAEQYISSYNLLYAQNAVLSNNIDYTNQMYSTDTQNIQYQNKKINNYKYFNKILAIIYFILMSIATIFLLRSKKMKSWIVKFIIVAILVLYPFFIYYLESYIYEFITYIMSFFNGEKYTKTTNPTITNTKLSFT
jgi:hypothetical protein